jgi:hypothetical protein
VDASESVDESKLGARIAITGDARALMTIVCDKDFARHLACTMFMYSPEALTDEETNDALGELVNIIGGNVKGVIPVETQLSLPSVGPATDFSEDDSYDDDIVVSGECDGRKFFIRLQSAMDQTLTV